MSAPSNAVTEMPPTARSRVSNGNAVLPGVDGRSTWVRRLRDLIALHLSALGGDEAVSEAERSIVRRAWCSTCCFNPRAREGATRSYRRKYHR